jgi:hypothetical protein
MCYKCAIWGAESCLIKATFHNLQLPDLDPSPCRLTILGNGTWATAPLGLVSGGGLHRRMGQDEPSHGEDGEPVVRLGFIFVWRRMLQHTSGHYLSSGDWDRCWMKRGGTRTAAAPNSTVFSRGIRLYNMSRLSRRIKRKYRLGNGSQADSSLDSQAETHVLRTSCF